MLPSAALAGAGICGRPECRPIRDARLAQLAAPPPPTAPTAPAAPQRPAAQRAAARAEAQAAQLARVRAGNKALLLNLLDRTHTPRSHAKLAGERIPEEMSKRLDPPPIVDLVHVPVSYAYRRDYDGPFLVLDRSAAWVAAITTVDVAHGYGGWQHTGAITLPPSGPILPGWYEVRIAAWYETAMPSPLSATDAAPVGSTVWVAEPLARLLRDLAEAERWGGGSLDVVDSYTHPIRVRLDEGGWGSAIRDIRAEILAEFGPSAPYVAVKRGYAQAVATMHGRPVPGAAREYTPSGIHRDDITDTIKTQMAVTIWRNADAINRLAPDPVIAIQNTDEIVITPAALAAITSGPHSAGRPRIDETGVNIGSYTIKRGAK